MPTLPSGRVTFLFTDIEGSTRLLHALGERYAHVLTDHRRLLREAFARHGGVEVDTQGDSFFVGFGEASAALASAREAQRALADHRWPDGAAVRVRMGIHTGEPLIVDSHYVGLDVHRAARIAAAAHGGQVIVSERTRELADDAAILRDIGAHRLKDLPEVERLYQLVIDGLPASFPPPRAHEDALEAAGLPDYSLPPADVPCPYKGLVAFQPEDSDLFFGREALTTTLVERLIAGGFLAVVGPSGSGKSSLVRAGVVPVLERSGARAAILSPGAHPLRALAAARGATLVVVDQFEEVFTLCRDETERVAFIDALLAAPDGQTRVVVTLRADFYGHCAAYSRLASALEDHQALVGPMTEEELRRAIEQPAERAGLLLEPGVVEGILRDVVGQPGALPLLSQSLRETWRRRSGRMLTLIGYLQSGGVDGAVAKSAEALYRDVLTRPQQELARNILLRLTELGENTEDTRRRVSIAELIPRAELADDVGAVLRILAEARLVTIGKDTVEVAHEALIRHWPTLRAWLDEDREGRLVHRRLTEAAQEWQTLGRDPGALYRGARLAATGDWATNHDAELNQLEREFLTASRQGSQREAERQRRTNRRLRALLAGTLVLLAAALAAGFVAFVQQRNAAHSARVANGQRLSALALVEERPDVALLLAVEGARLDPSAETKGSLFDTLMKYRHVLRAVRTSQRMLRLAAPRRGGLVAAADNNGGLALYDAGTLRLRHSETLGAIYDLAFAPDGRTVYVADDRGVGEDERVIRAVDSVSGRVRWKQRVPRGEPPGERGLNVMLGGARVVWVGSGTLSVLRAHDGAVTLRERVPTAGQVVPVSDRRVFVLRDDAAEERDILTGRIGRRFRLARGEASAIAASRDGSLLALGEETGAVSVLQLADGRRVRMQGRHDGLIESVVFSPDGSLLASAGEADGSILLWNPRTGELVDTLTGHGPGLRALTFAADGRTLVSGGLDSTLSAWDIAGDRAMLRRFDRPGPPCEGETGVCFFPQFSVAPDGRRLAHLSSDYRLRFTAARGLRAAGALPERGLICCQEPAFSPDGRRLATASPNEVALWDVTAARHIRTLFKNPAAWDPSSEPPPTDTVAYSPDGRTIAANDRAIIHVVDAASGARRARFVAPAYVTWLTYSPDGRSLAATIEGGRVATWDLDDGRRLWARQVDDQPVNSVKFSPEGDLLLVSGESGRIHFLDPRTGRPVRSSVLAHSAFFASLSFARDGSAFVTSGTDGQTILWDTASGRALGSPFDARTPSWSQFSSDGHTVFVVAQDDGYAFDGSLSAWRKRACSIVGRPLNRAEWQRFMGDRDYEPSCR